MMIVYRATNVINNKIYIGMSSHNLARRKNEHYAKARSDKSSYSYFHNAIRKHGEDNFKWEILTECETKTKLIVLEKFYIAVYGKMGKLYNLTDGGEGRENYKCSEETKQKLREINLGKKQSEETKLKKSLIFKGRVSPMKGRKQSAYFIEQQKGRIPWNKGTKGLMVAWNKGLKSTIDQNGEKNPAYRHDIETQDIFNYIKKGYSRKTIAEIMKCSQRTIDRRINKEVN